MGWHHKKKLLLTGDHSCLDRSIACLSPSPLPLTVAHDARTLSLQAAGRASPWTNDARSSLNPCDLFLGVIVLDDSLDASAPVTATALTASMYFLSPGPITPE